MPTRHPEHQYLDILKELIEKLLQHGASSNRTAVKAVKVPVRMMRFDLSRGEFPLFTTKKLHLKSIIHENLWFLSGDTNNNTLKDKGVRIWNEWATEDGSLGPLYGAQWRHFPAGDFFRNMTDDEVSSYIGCMDPKQREIVESVGSARSARDLQTLRRVVLYDTGIDQISQAMFLLKNRPNSRRIIVTAWNPQVVPSDDMPPQENVMQGRAALAACHTFFQFITEELTLLERHDWQLANRDVHLLDHVHLLDTEETDPKVAKAFYNERKVPTHRLNLSFYCRSQDTFLGTPFNIAGYALLLRMFAAQANMVPGELVWVGGDVHLYQNHLEQAKEQASRDPRPFPTLLINPEVKSIFDYKYEDFKLFGYDPHPSIKGDVAV